MKMIIEDGNKICEIQKEFSKHFPFLKLKFFGFELDEKKTFTKSNMITNTHKTINEIRHVHSPGYLSLNGNQKVSTLAQNFKKNFGINIQVFRKSFSSWLQTSIPYNWTLNEQNSERAEKNKQMQAQANCDYEQYYEQNS